MVRWDTTGFGWPCGLVRAGSVGMPLSFVEREDRWLYSSHQGDGVRGRSLGTDSRRVGRRRSRVVLGVTLLASRLDQVG